MTQRPPKGRTKVATLSVDASTRGDLAPFKLFESEEGVRVHLHPLAQLEIEVDLKLATPASVRVRDAVGSALAHVERLEIGALAIELDLTDELCEAALLGLEIGLYRYKRVFGGELPPFKISIQQNRGPLLKQKVEGFVQRGRAVNLARHLTNLPPNLLNPVTYAQFLKLWFSQKLTVKLEIWDERRLAKERMNLHLAVGIGSATPPRLVVIQYRPRGVRGAPIAIVGKGITFDSGGLDIKPAAGMRLMKKDMGGSAAAVGVLDWAVASNLKVNLDVYLALAENSIGGRAFRPSDVLRARDGQTVEIHNTDAEGRLVLADSLALACEKPTKPRYIIDLATLTGAIKVALGSQIAGLFANNSELATDLAEKGQEVGDMAWVMPLYQKYRTQLSSGFADMINSPDGFGGAITAALFLQKFVGRVSWAHFDIYAWKDSPEGAWLEGGGSGQAVLALTQWLQAQEGR